MTKEQVLEVVKAHKWNIQRFNGFPLYLHCAATLSGLEHQPVFVNYSHFFYLFYMEHAYMYYDEKDLSSIGDDYYKKIKNKSDSLHVMLMETVSKRIYKHPEKYNEIVEGLKVSGLKRPNFMLLGTNFQPFHFYKDHITIALNGTGISAAALPGKAFGQPFMQVDMRIKNNRLILPLYQPFLIEYNVKYKEVVSCQCQSKK